MANPNARILIVDDERFFRDAISEILEGEGWSCATCEDGESALEAAEDPEIGVVVLDIRMPGIDGIEVLRRLRDAQPELRVIMLSASTDQELVLDALRLGASDYLGKPLHEEELVLAVRRALEGHELASNWTRLRSRLDRLVEVVYELKSKLEGRPREEGLELLRCGAAEAAARILEARKASMMLLDESGRALEVVATVGHEIPPEEMDSVPLGEGVAGVALKKREPFVVGDVREDGRFAGAADASRYETASFAIAPLESQRESFGVLCVTDRRDGEGFGDEDLALLRLLALQLSELMAGHASADAASDGDFDEPEDEAAVAVDEQSERDAEMARLICDAVVSEVEPQRMISAVLQPLVQALDAAPVSIFTIDGASGELLLEGEADGGSRSERRRLDRSRGLTGVVLQTGQLVASPDPLSDPRFDAEVDTPEDGEATPMLCVPLRLRGKVFGVFRAFMPPGHEPSARTGEVLSAALSAAVRNVLLYRSLVDSIAEVAEVRRKAGS